MTMSSYTPVIADAAEQPGWWRRVGRVVVRAAEVIGPSYLWWAGIPLPYVEPSSSDAWGTPNTAITAHDEIMRQAIRQRAYRR